MEKVLITGGAGFVGRHLVERLWQETNSIWIIDNLFTGKHPDKWLKDFRKVEQKDNITEYSKGDKKVVFIQEDMIYFLMNQINNRSSIVLPNFTHVFHLASIVGGRSLIDGDPILIATDLAIDSLFFVWLTRNKNKVGKVLYASSSAAYPIHLQTKEKHIALPEDLIRFDEHLSQPDMTYGWSKLTGEYLSVLTAKQYGMSVVCVRPFSGYGKDQDVVYPIPAIARRIARREDPVEVWGTGEQGRDFVHIDDCVEAMVLVIEKISDGRGINIGTGTLTSFNEIIKIYCEIEGYNPEIKQLLDKPVGVQSRYSDSKAIFELGWKPKISLRDGLADVLSHAKEQKI